MKLNVWNIKEMLSIPAGTGPNRFSNRSSVPSDNSSLSDSQLSFGSQFRPENVHSIGTPLELGKQLGQHNSQDREPSIFTKYQSLPLLFDDNAKEKGSLSVDVGRVENVFESFEAYKDKIKDKYDREVLSTFISSIKDRLQELQACLDKLGETLDSRNQSMLVQLEAVSKTRLEALCAVEQAEIRGSSSRSPQMQVTSAMLPKGTPARQAQSCQLTARVQDALQSHCGSVLKALLEMESRLAAKDTEISDVKSSVQLLKEGLELLPAQLCDQHLKLYEELGFLKLPNTLAELHTFISSTRLPPHTADNSSQTSPGLCLDHALGKENTCQPCCRDRGVCSSSDQSQPCVTGGEQQGGFPGSGTSMGDLTTASGGKVSPIVAVARGRENTSLQEVKRSVETPSCANHLHVRPSGRYSGGSQNEHCSVAQEVPPSTPLRKAFRRGTWRPQPVTPSQQRQPLSVRQDTSGQRDWATVGEVKHAAVGKKAKQWSGRIPWNKAMGRKKTCPAMRKDELSRSTDGGLKHRKANGVMELESSRKNCFPRHMEALDLGSSDPIFVAPSQHILSSAHPRLTNNFSPLPRSSKSLQQLADKRRSLEMKKGVNVPSVKINFWDSSPKQNVFSLCSTTGEEQMSCFSLRSPAASQKPRPVEALPQQNMARCSLDFFDSDYSD